MRKHIICWWSGGVTSAVACRLAIDSFGLKSCTVVFIDTMNEDEDTYRFKTECEKWYGCKIQTITGIGDKYTTIQDVWRKHKSLNVAYGAICSNILKQKVRKDYQKTVDYDHQVFGFEFDKKEMNRALALSKNHPSTKAIFPLLMMQYSKGKCIEIIEEVGIEIPRAYSMGFHNNNCLNTGCVQGGLGYWQKMKRDFPEKFNAMADMEHDLTEMKGKPVTMLKDQAAGGGLVFLRKHPIYPNLKSIDEMPKVKVKPLFECNGFCGTNDLNKPNNTYQQLNLELY